ncbi:hypothetical protein ACI79C_16495 [Geodermatophilus sp. SYSU D00697]
MNTWVQRGLRTALLTGGLLAAGAGVAAADENDVTADVLGVTATVPVEDGALLQTPVVTGTGEDLTVGDGAGDGLVLPVDTSTEPGTTALGDDGSGGLSAPVRVTEADDAPPDPTDGLTVTVPVGTSGGGTAGTEVTVPIATGDLGEVLDGDPSTGTVVDVDLTDPVVPGPGGSGVLLDLEDAVSVGDGDPATGREPVLEMPVSVDGDRPTTVELPVPGTEDDGPLSGDSVEVDLGGLLGTGRTDEDQDDGDRDDEADLSLPIGTGDLLPDLLGGTAASDSTVDVDLGGLLGDDGTVVAVPVDEGGAGTGSDLLVRVTLPIGLPGLSGGADRDGTEDGHGSGQGDGSGSGQGDGTGTGTGDGDGTGTGDGPAPDSGAPGTRTEGSGTGTGTGGTRAGGSGTGGTSAGGAHGDCTGTGGVPGTAGGDTSSGTGPAPGGASASGAAGSDPGRAGAATGDACGTGSPQAAATRPASTTATLGGPLTASAGLLVTAGLLLAAGRGRLWRDPVRR